MSRKFTVQASQRRNRAGDTTVVIRVETIAENGEPHQGPIMIECPSGSVPDLSCALEIAMNSLEDLGLGLR